MKKILSIALTGAIALSGGAYNVISVKNTASAVDGDFKKYEFFYYDTDYNGEYIRIRDTVGSLSGEVVVPETIDGLPVKEISQWAFYQRGMTTVVIPPTVTTLVLRSFQESHNLEYMVIPENVDTVGGCAFYRCDAMKYIVFENKYCDIDGSEDTLPESAIIYGYEGSTAQAYAEINDREFRLIGEDLPVISEETTTAPVSATTTDTTTATTTVAVETETLKGDANGDGEVTIADAVAILQYLANSDEYPLSEQGAENADVLGDDGVNTEDALQIQKLDAGVIETL